MNIYPLCGETPVEKVFPSNGGLVFDQVAVMFGKFAWINTNPPLDGNTFSTGVSPQSGYIFMNL
jgi:hypothetical protein